MMELDYEQYADLEWKEQMQRELNARVAGRLVDEAEPGPYRMAMMSALKGAYDDIHKDIRRGRITAKQAKQIIDDLLRARLITPMLAAVRRERIDELDEKLALDNQVKDTEE